MPQSILITGCSSGIGHATAIALHQRGYRVFAAARKEADLTSLKSLGIEGVILDVNDASSMQKAIDQVLQATGGTLDALFNNAGFLRAGAIEDLNQDLIRQQFETNVFGPMELIRLVLPVMRRQGHGRIIQNSSILGVVAIPLCGAYNASKFALEGFSNTLRQELRGTNIHVSIINPGPITSKLRDNAHALHLTEFDNTAIKESHFAKQYERMASSYFTPNRKDQFGVLEPTAVIKKVIHALESNNPRAHYFIGWIACAMALLRRVSPDCLLDWVLAKAR